MALQCYSATAPGSLILMGEYAVLNGYPAIVMAINKKITVSITPRADKIIKIKSALGEYINNYEQLEITPPFEYVITTLKQKSINCGLDINIESEFSDKMGLGSSAAVTVALIKAIYQLQNTNLNAENIYQDAIKIIRSVQGKGSGADIAASIYSGVIAFISEPLSIKEINIHPEISVIYSGEKTTTTLALKKLSAKHNEKPAFINTILSKLGELSQQAITYLSQKDWINLGKAMNEAQKLLTTLGVSTPSIDNIVAALNLNENIFGAKLSGSGLGDCVIGLGNFNSTANYKKLDVWVNNDI